MVEARWSGPQRFCRRWGAGGSGLDVTQKSRVGSGQRMAGGVVGAIWCEVPVAVMRVVVVQRR